MRIIYHKGRYVPVDTVLFGTDHRALRYADGCFEAVRIMHGRPVFWRYHMERLFGTLRTLRIKSDETPDSLLSIAHQLLRKNTVTGGAILRISAARSGGGTYFPVRHDAEWWMELRPVENDEYQLSPEHTGGWYRDFQLPAHSLGNHKTLNKTVHVMAAIHAQTQGWNDALLLNQDAVLCEAVSSNAWVFDGQRLLTPPLSSGCLNGTVRRIILEHADKFPVSIEEAIISEAMVEQASEVWTTNASAGIKAFSRFNSKPFASRLAAECLGILRQMALSSIQDSLENQP